MLGGSAAMGGAGRGQRLWSCHKASRGRAWLGRARGAEATAAGPVGSLPLTTASWGRQGHSLCELLEVLEQMTVA